eukprot:1135278-Pyramimonas_sp.AAC.1
MASLEHSILPPLEIVPRWGPAILSQQREGAQRRYSFTPYANKKLRPIAAIETEQLVASGGHLEQRLWHLS